LDHFDAAGVPISVGPERTPGLVALGKVGKGYQDGCLIFEDGVNAMAGEKFRRRQRASVAAEFKYSFRFRFSVSVKNGRLRQALGGERRQQQSGGRLRHQSCRANDAEKDSTFQLTVRLPLF